MRVPEQSSDSFDRRALLVVLSFLAFGVVIVGRFLLWSTQPLWGLVLVPPLLFLTVFAWLAFKPAGQEGMD